MLRKKQDELELLRQQIQRMANGERPILKEIPQAQNENMNTKSFENSEEQVQKQVVLKKRLEEKKEMMKRYEEMKKEIIGAEKKEMKVNFIFNFIKIILVEKITIK